jgi:hypothetical protein
MGELDLLSCLVAECQRARRSAGRKNIRVAVEADVSERTISRFEGGETWPRDPERIVAAYASVSGVPAPDLWRRAVDRWANQ